MDRDDGSDELRDPEDGVFEPPEKPTAVDDWGTSAEEQREGEPLSQRLREEEPDVQRHPRHPTERLQDDGPVDDTPELIADPADDDDSDLSAEEEAMTTRRDPPGATSHPDDYVRDEDSER